MHVVHTPHPSSEGAIAVCGALQELRATNIAAVRAIFLWKNKLGDRGAAAVAALVQQSAIPGFERLWVAEVHLSHNNITVHGAQELFAAAHRYPRNANTGLVPLWLRLEHNGIGEYLRVFVHFIWCVCVHAVVALWCGVLRCVARAIESLCVHACISHACVFVHHTMHQSIVLCTDLSAMSLPPHCQAESRGDRNRGVQRTVNAGHCGVSQCCQASVPSLHLHLVETQDEKKVEAARTAPPVHWRTILHARVHAAAAASLS